MESPSLVHVLLVSFPGQGHINPLLRLGNILASKGLLVTFTTTKNMGKKMIKANNIKDGEFTPIGEGFLRFEFFEDGFEEDDKRRADFDFYRSALESAGKREISRLVKRNAEEKRPVSGLINNAFIPWVCDVAEELDLPSAALWVQSCACFAGYYYYYHSLVPFPTETEPKIDVQLPCMPLLKYDEIPSFLHPSSPFSAFREIILGQFKNLGKAFCILMDTFDQLEPDIVSHMSKICPIKTIGPLFKHLSIQGSPVRGDLLAAADHCIEWLDTQPSSSVVYISFGSVVYLKQEQIDEIAHGLLNSGVSFLWVVRPPPKELGVEAHVLPEKLTEKVNGKVVEWSPQERVLAHPAVACFVTHCGWNSSMEALASGVPVVAFPQWGDQVTNAVYLDDVFKIGLRLSRGEAENRIVSRYEIQKCLLEATTGPGATKLKQNALKWKAEAESAVAEYGGPSDRNIKEFVEELIKKSITDKMERVVLS